MGRSSLTHYTAVTAAGERLCLALDEIVAVEEILNPGRTQDRCRVRVTGDHVYIVLVTFDVMVRLWTLRDAQEG